MGVDCKIYLAPGTQVRDVAKAGKDGTSNTAKKKEAKKHPNGV